MSGLLKVNLPEEFPYLYETHMHTSQASACAINTGAEIARSYKEAGYTGVIVTDHFFHGNTAVNRDLPWEEWVDGFCAGYEEAKAEGDKIGLQVFFGWEAAYNGTEFLINGLSKEWLKAHPEIRDCTIEEQFEMVHRDGGYIVHCHPYREEWYIPEIRLYPDYCDAVETVNATHSSVLSKSHNDPLYDERAKEYAIKIDKPMTAGSDQHSVSLIYGGIAFKRRLESGLDYAKAIRDREPAILLNGNETVENKEPYYPPYVEK